MEHAGNLVRLAEIAYRLTRVGMVKTGLGNDDIQFSERSQFLGRHGESESGVRRIILVHSPVVSHKVVKFMVKDNKLADRNPAQDGQDLPLSLAVKREMRGDDEPVIAVKIFPYIVVQKLNLLVVQVDVDLSLLSDGRGERVENHFLHYAEPVKKQHDALLPVRIRGRYEITYTSGGIDDTLIPENQVGFFHRLL